MTLFLLFLVCFFAYLAIYYKIKFDRTQAFKFYSIAEDKRSPNQDKYYYKIYAKEAPYLFTIEQVTVARQRAAKILEE